MKHVSNVYTRETLKEIWESLWGREGEREEIGDLIQNIDRS
jgi:hypothetical protein